MFYYVVLRACVCLAVNRGPLLPSNHCQSLSVCITVRPNFNTVVSSANTIRPNQCHCHQQELRFFHPRFHRFHQQTFLGLNHLPPKRCRAASRRCCWRSHWMLVPTRSGHQELLRWRDVDCEAISFRTCARGSSTAGRLRYRRQLHDKATAEYGNVILSQNFVYGKYTSKQSL